eukprot:TRINITY_DN66429_c5_g9_i1.p1 TRINITY_DN66429_c5_g9~~TRINITY_DN66429_c5_g9_i1.p1  ORF type:complete len:230 (+),score=8.12 TRINITY_DN66429_c5_g9_i1:49-738(+)
MEGLWASLSAALGWSYFCAWTVSFYPQIVLNRRRKSVTGMSFDFVVLNITGYSSYALFCYMSLGGPQLVQWNDFSFALHATLVSIFTGLQILHYDRGGQRVHPAVWSLCAILWTVIVVAVISRKTSPLGVVKLIITLVKYVPQAILNYCQQSTVGWSIWSVLLDLTGGTLSFAQLWIDRMMSQWKHGVAPPLNVPKLGIGLLSTGFDLLFILQHYVLYPPPTTAPPIEL